MSNTHQEPPVCYILVGPPGVGKTTFVQKHLENVEVLSTDNILLAIAKEEGITYNEAFEKHFGKAQAQFDAKMTDCIVNKKSFVVDRTNLTVKTRRRTLSRLSNDYTSTAFVFSVPPVDELVERITKRAEENTQFVPRFVIEDMLKKYEAPTSLEGFGMIIHV